MNKEFSSWPLYLKENESIEDQYYTALEICINRYADMLNQYGGIATIDSDLQFIDTFNQGLADRLPLMKLNRWIGFIQGTVIRLGLTTVENERDFTRPLFRPLDFGGL